MKRDPNPVVLIAALMAVDPPFLARSKERLVQAWGEIELESPVFEFTFTDYYRQEMGEKLIKQFVSFGKPISMACLADIKGFTLSLEGQLSQPGEGMQRRRVNVDPGYLSMDNLVLATTKHRGHRICIAPGLYAEVTLLYQSGRFQPLDWTYADYRTELAQNFFRAVRKRLSFHRADVGGAK